ncbi:hypothetical protein ABZV93_24090 [Actinopolymorpha sp. NPDC004070]
MAGVDEHPPLLDVAATSAAITGKNHVGNGGALTCGRTDEFRGDG